MKSFNIFIKKTDNLKIEDIIFVKDGFSWTAFIFSNFWFLYHKMWREFFALLIASILLTLFDGFLLGVDKFFLETALAIIIGLNANYWLAAHLERENYEFSGVAFGKNLAEATLNFIKDSKKTIDFSDFDMAILDPKSHKKFTKKSKSQPYFTV